MLERLLPMLLQFWWLIPLMLIVGFLKSPMGKGMVGEFIVNFGFQFLLNKSDYQLIKNVTLPTEDGTTQIDHIILSEYGIFVLETKNYRGWITGTAKSAKWKQTIYKVKNEFQNPLRQNYKHTRTLEDHLRLPQNSIHSVIAFVGDCELKSDFPENVCKGLKCFAYIKSFKTKVYTTEEVQGFIEEIENLRLGRTIKTHLDHKKHVKQLVEQKANQCPKCGSEMVERIAKKGANAGKAFPGCSSFPKCRHTVF